MTFTPGREARWEYAEQTIQAIEEWNCAVGRGCVHGADVGTPQREEFGPGGVCHLLAAVFLDDPIEEMDDDDTRVTCRSYEQRPDTTIPAGQLTLDELGVVQQ